MTGWTADRQGGADYRVTLANERTFLAWIRTALAAAAASVAVTHLVDIDSTSLRLGLALLLGLGALAGAVWSAWRWRQVEEATHRGAGIRTRTAPWAVALIMAVTALGSVLVAVTGR